jgi:hypothetical protein
MRSLIRMVCLAVAVLTAGQVQAGFIAFNASGTFIAPTAVTSVRVLTIGGGGGGANGRWGGGGSGYISVGTFAITPMQNIAVTVGGGGTGAEQRLGDDNIVGLTPGQASSFGAFLTSLGGGVAASGGPAGNGGSGGGGSGNVVNGSNITPAGSGGSGGSDGQSARSAGGVGQGSYLSSLSLFTENVLSAGAGGIASTFSGFSNGGGGAGGILINGVGPNAFNGSHLLSAKGGAGYGAGGGAGGFDDFANIPTRHAGGNGANGLVYVEWDDISAVPEPATIALFGIGALGMGLVARRKKKLTATV